MGVLGVARPGKSHNIVNMHKVLDVKDSCLRYLEGLDI